MKLTVTLRNVLNAPTIVITIKKILNFHENSTNVAQSFAAVFLHIFKTLQPK
jgi:hypothetical protein